MQYILLIAYDETLDEALSPDESAAQTAAYGAWAEQCAARGALRGGERLRPTSDATTVQVRNEQVVTTDGPFAETKEQISGYFIIDVRRPRPGRPGRVDAPRRQDRQRRGPADLAHGHGLTCPWTLSSPPSPGRSGRSGAASWRP